MNVYFNLSVLITVTVGVGWFLTFALFQFKTSELSTRNLNTKILMWLPIGALFLGLLYLGAFWLGLALGIIVLASVFELYKNYNQTYALKIILYHLIFVIGLLHLIPVNHIGQNTFLIYLVVATVFSDVLGFFMGNLFGRHKLPDSLNSGKSWEGVLGQMLGAFLGVLLIKHFVVDFSIWLFIPIGIGSALGDLLNSYIKRALQIKNWSNWIPGHGGFFDRFSSLAGSALLSYYFVILFLS